MKTKVLIAVLALLPALLFAQKEKPLDYASYDIWKELENHQIADDGQWVSYELNPREGDGDLFFVNPDNDFKNQVPRATQAKITPVGTYAAFRIKPHHDTIQQMKREEVPEEKRPDDSLGIYVFEQDKLIKQAHLVSFQVPETTSEWMAYLYNKEEKPEKDTTQTEKAEKSEETKENGEKKEAGKEEKDLHQLVITNPVSGEEYEFSRVKAFDISRDGARISFIKVPADSIDKAAVHTFDTRRETHDSLPVIKGEIKNLTADMHGQYLAFIHSQDTVKKKAYALYFWQEGNEEPTRLVDTLTEAIPEKWTVSEYGDIFFSRDNSNLFFGTAKKPEPEPKDTLLESEKVNLDVWHYQDKRLQTQQLEELEEDKKKNYLALYHIDKEKIVQLADKQLPEINLEWHGNTEIALGENNKPYLDKISYEWPDYADYYHVDLKTGERTQVLKESQNFVSLSPAGKYVLYYNFADSCWYTHSTATGNTTNLTGSLDVPFHNVEHDYPNEAYPYGDAGWTKDDEYVLLYDEFDIWKFDPTGEEKPVNLTNGRKAQIKYRYTELDKEIPYIKTKDPILAKTFNEKTKASGYSFVDVADAETERLVMEDVRYYRAQKARNADKLLWRKTTVDRYPDVWISNLDFEDAQKLTNANTQQEDYVWADVELMEYITADGKKEEALVYKPENFDPEKTYPMMVYFYRLHSDNLHRHYTPRASYSIINPLFYASNGYVVLIPNIRYKIGYPGESAFNHVIGATLQMARKPYIERKNIGVQGQSWGGYEIAYIVTRTNIFKAASPGAPVSNMTSAYGGIRWGSGLVRQFQYEESQSRIGGSLWEKPLQYIENSPIFWADKIHTPLLIRHDDDDGAVPWYQGIELFNAMRRLNKPAWLINYNDAPHNLTEKRANRKDWSKRMKQYFDHYLKGRPAPVWLEEGIPAIKKGDTYGFELTD